MHAHEKKAIFIVIGTSKSQRYRVTNGSASEARLHQTKTLRTRHCISYMLEPLIIMYRFQLHVVRQVSMCPGGSVCWDTRHVLWQGTTNPASLHCDTECWQEINKKKNTGQSSSSERILYWLWCLAFSFIFCRWCCWHLRLQGLCLSCTALLWLCSSL